jgi:hypothetical protein
MTDISSGTFSINANGGSGGRPGSVSEDPPGGSGGSVSVSDSSSLISTSGTSTNGATGGKGVNLNTVNGGPGGGGGAGVATSITGSSITRGGGGGGGAGICSCNPAGTIGGSGGSGGGGAGSGGFITLSGTQPKIEGGRTYNWSESGDYAATFAVAGTANTGGGGGSGSAYQKTELYTIDGISNHSRNGRSGGSGIVIIKYAFPPNPVFNTTTAIALVDPRAESVQIPAVDLTSYVGNRSCITLDKPGESLDLDGSTNNKYKVEVIGASGVSSAFQGSNKHLRVSGDASQMSAAFDSGSSKSLIKISRPTNSNFNEELTLTIKTDNRPGADCSTDSPTSTSLIVTIKPYGLSVNQKNSITLS